MAYAQIQRQQQSWFSDWGNLLLLGLVVYSVVFGAWLLAGWGDERTLAVVKEAGFVPLMFVGIIFAGRMVFLKSVDYRYHRAWGLIAVGFLSWLVADALWAYFVLVHGSVPEVSLADAAYLSVWVFLIAGILLFPTNRLTRSDLIRYAIDYAIILISVAVLVSYFVVGPELIGYAAEPTIGTYILLSYPVADTLMILAVASLLIRRPVPGTLRVIVLLGLGLVIYSLADLRWVYLEVRGLEVREGLLYSTWFIGQLLVCVAPQLHYDVINRGRTSVASNEHIDALRTITPYFAAFLGTAVVLTAGLPELITRFGIIVVLMMVLLGLFGVRQAYTVRENARFRVEKARQESEDRFQALVEFSSDLISVVDRDLTCRFQSPSVIRFTGRDTNEFLGKHMLAWVHPDDRTQVERVLKDVIDERDDRVRFEWRLVAPDGDVIHLETIVSSELNNPVINGLVLNSRDVTDRKHLEEELTYHAYHDPLTNLPNRASFLNTLMLTIRTAGRGHGVGLIFLDLDRFKQINDTLGHEAGDELLVRVSDRLLGGLRTADVLGRLGGDEFTVLLPALKDEREAGQVAQRILELMQVPVPVAGHDVQISFSIGVAHTESPHTEPSELLRHADSAMYAAKRNGRNRIEIFEHWMEAQLTTIERDREIANSARLPLRQL
jgi:diguanylate cyclase (GGDEF)-like protein/PAS domain S-box-containing protein